MATSTPPRPSHPREAVESVVIRFAGDSGDGMQVTGSQFTVETALAGNDLATFPDFPAEIRAPAGTTFGVSAFQIRFGTADVLTAGDAMDVLVAMNPAALQVELRDLKPSGTIVVDTGAFTERNLAKAGFPTNPLQDGSLAKYRVLPFDITKLTAEAVKAFGLGTKEAHRCRNMWALGLMLWMYGRERAATVEWLRKKFAQRHGAPADQEDDGIAEIGAAIAAAYAGALGATSRSGPGIALKTEMLGLAIATELPIVLVDSQRAGPSTGMPTKTEQSDLFQAVLGRNADSPLVVIAPSTAGDCFPMGVEAVRLATKYMTPVIVLSDTYLAHAAEPWRIPEERELPTFPVRFRTDPVGVQPRPRRRPRGRAHPRPLPEPVPPQPRRPAAPLRACARPRAEQRPAGAAAARGVPRGRARVQQDRRQAVPRGRAAGGDPGECEMT